ncbi:hypothetical protein GH714_021787 [Hevea brasiliensis]|uniref:Uncharacterized protein n=1 Tax=Hevea brasiliensis TaxID=3981 RepID=A0A6A6NIE8_HEVBR|nr:hypothetical protein GH714_021787 [Hevea brasiliensis]
MPSTVAATSSPPLPHHEELQGGHLYYLLPISTSKNTSTTTNTTDSNSNAINSTSLSKLAPYRMSFDNQRVLKRLTDAVVFPRYNSTGVWKVKLVICPEQLAEILAQEARTEELIESVRTVAKCGNGVSSSVASSDQWSVSSSWKGSGEKCGEDDCLETEEPLKSLPRISTYSIAISKFSPVILPILLIHSANAKQSIQLYITRIASPKDKYARFRLV